MPDSLVESIQEYINAESALFLHTLDKKITQKIIHSQKLEEPANNKVGIGLYYYED